MPDFVTRQTPDGVILYASPSCRQRLGYESDELEGTMLTDHVHPSDSDGLAAGEGPRTVTQRLRRRDGSYIWCETISWPVHHPEAGDIVELVAVARDADWRRQV